MAQLKNTVVSGSIRATDTLYGTTGQFTTLNIPTTSNGQNYGPGTSGQVLKTNGTSVYWSGSDSSISDGSTSTNTPTSAAVANFVQGKGYALNSEIASQQSNVTTSKAYAIGDLFIYDNKLYKTTAAIAQGGVITPNTNCVETTIDENLIRDIQTNGSSIVNNGVANIPLANTSTPGVVTVGTGLVISNNKLVLAGATAPEIKSGASGNKAVSTYRQHEAVFYGLAKVAGADMASSNNAVGTYTIEAKSAINSMLSTPEIISGTTPSIEAKANVQYICGECSTLSITTPANGIIDIIFQSGSTPTTLTVTPPTGMTMKWPGWFNPSQLEANHTYEINILNGVYGVVMLWA